MSQVWYTSDTHFDHRLVSGIRGFETPEEHDENIVETWNATVGPRDVVWVLGDVGMGRLARFEHRLAALEGTMHLIAGNHDEVHPMHTAAPRLQHRWLEHFASVHTAAKHKVGGVSVLLSHFPYRGEGEREGDDRYPQWRLRESGYPLIHGHVHSRSKATLDPLPQVHVGWDAWARPVNRDEVAGLFVGMAA